MPKTITDVAIVGGGVAGVGAALALAKTGRYKVTLFEQRGGLLLASSNVTPGRAGHGFHYLDTKTGETYLESTIEVLREFPGCSLGFGYKDTDYRRHGIYVIAKDSQSETKQILNSYRSYKDHYEEMVKKDPENKLFGDPKDFYKVRDKNEFSRVINLNKVDTIVDTREELLNWPKVRQRLLDGVYRHTKIKIVKNAHMSIKYSADRLRYVLRNKNNDKEYHFKHVINATWENIEYLLSQISIPYIPRSRTNRLKAIVTFQLPEVLKTHPSIFFCMGPFCMFSNMGDGTGMITYAPTTNIHSSSDVLVPEKYRDYLDDNCSKEDKTALAKKIISGVAEFLPPIRDVTSLRLGFGIVRTMGSVDIFDPKSDFHRRRELGVKLPCAGIIVNASMKLMHFLRNGQLVVKYLDRDVINVSNLARIKESLNHIKRNHSQKIDLLPRSVENVLETHLRTVYLPNMQQLAKKKDAKKDQEIKKIAEEIYHSRLTKQKSCAAIRERFPPFDSKPNASLKRTSKHQQKQQKSYFSNSLIIYSLLGIPIVLIGGYWLLRQYSVNSEELKNFGLFKFDNSRTTSSKQSNDTLVLKFSK